MRHLALTLRLNLILVGARAGSERRVRRVLQDRIGRRSVDDDG
jgi:hypothetical protein